MSTLIIKNVVKMFGSLKCVSDISLTIEPGEKLALLGHNGAGKTTLIRMILGLISPSSGSIEVVGEAPGSTRARRSIGFLPENVAFHGSLSGREQMHHFAALKNVSSKIADGLLERVGLADAADRWMGTYSKGMRQRVGLAQALLGKPRLALLDEPTSGLDPISRGEFYDIIEELSGAGTAVLISSHALTEMETRTDRIAILSKGVLVANDTLALLRKEADLPIRFNITATQKSVDEVADDLGGKRINGQTVELFCDPMRKIEILNRISAFGAKISDVDVTPASLEELYRHFSAASAKNVNLRELN